MERTILTDSTPAAPEILPGVRLLDPFTESDTVADVCIQSGCVSSITPSASEPSGLWLLPGLVDLHVHLRIPGGEEAETLQTGLRAAVAGGVTTLGMMPNTSPPLDRVQDTLRLAEKANALGLARVHPVPCVTLGRLGMECVDLEEFSRHGITAFTDDGSPVSSDEILAEALKRLSSFSGTLIEHPEIAEIASGGAVNLGMASRKTGAFGIPECAEYEDVERCIRVLEGSGSLARLHLTHLSSPRSVFLVHEAASRGLRVTCDVTPHHLALNEYDLIRLGPAAKMNPPLRSEESRSELARLVSLGWVSAVASDHAPHPAASKNRSLQDAAFGITGLETLLPVTVDVLVNRTGMKPLEVVRMLTQSPASILGIACHGILPGMRCNMVLFAPDMTWKFERSHSRSSNSPFLGEEMRGRVLRVWAGNELYREGHFV